MSGACLVCGSPNLYRGFRCQTHYRYWRRHGTDRATPQRTTWQDRHQAEMVREQERELMRRAWGA